MPRKASTIWSGPRPWVGGGPTPFGQDFVPGTKEIEHHLLRTSLLERRRSITMWSGTRSQAPNILNTGVGSPGKWILHANFGSPRSFRKSHG